MKKQIILLIPAILFSVMIIAQIRECDNRQTTPVLVKSSTVIREKTESKKNKIQKGKNPDNPDGIMRERYMQRAGEDGKIPVNALVDAKNHIDNMPPTDDGGIWNWTWLGPGNIGGRIRAILIHPVTNHIWIGSVAGGIWKSANNGNTWSPVNDFMANLAITSLVVDPIDTDNMYAATGEGFGNTDALPGAGIFKSSDGGDSWEQLPATAIPGFQYVTRLAHHPDSSGVLYAATAGTRGIWKSNDGGNTWTRMLITTTNATDVKVHAGNPAYVIAGCSGDAYISDDYGSSWTKINTGNANQLPTNPGRCEVTFCPSNFQRIYISANINRGEIWRSDDLGQTWSRRSTGYQYLGKQGWYDNTIWIDPSNSNRLVVGGIDLWRSTDGGQTLTKISKWQNYHNGGDANSAHADHHIIVHHPDYDAANNPVVYFGNDGGIQMTEDVWNVEQESGWVNLCNSTLGITQFFGGSATSDASIIVGGAQDNDKLRYRQAGAWSGSGQWYQAQTGDGGYAAVNQGNPNILYGEYTNLSIKKSINGGDSYSNATTGLTDASVDSASLFISPFVMDPTDNSRLVAGGARIWLTTDNAGTWNVMRSNIGGRITASGRFFYWCCSAIDISASDNTNTWVGYENGNVAKTENGGGNWSRVDNQGPTPLPNRYVTDIAINPNNPGEVIVTFAGYNAANVWRTDDGGDTWDQITGNAPYNLPALQVNSVRFHPANTNWVYIGTDLGIFASEDKGQTWSTTPRYENNEGPVNVEVAELFWAGDELIAATHGRGMYKCRPLTNVYVDKNAPAGGNGTWANPYNNITAAVNATGNGTDIYVIQGTYGETPLLFLKRGFIEAVNGSVIIE
nr:hypothetical protein [Bacteroidota bacterium]